MQNNYYPASYQPIFPQQNATPISIAPRSESIVWVQGLEGAKAYPVAAGNNVLLMDSESSIFYIKSTDQAGIPQPIRIFDYTERKDEPEKKTVEATPAQFVTRDEFDKLTEELKHIQKMVKKGKKDE